MRLLWLVLLMGIFITHAWQRLRPANDWLITESTHAVDPIWYVTDIQHHIFDENGNLTKAFSAEKMTHAQKQQKTLVVKPQVTLQQAEQGDWQINAEHGLIYHEKSIEKVQQIDLWDNVHLQQSNVPDPAQLKTSAIELFPQQWRAQTSAPVSMQQKQNHLQGVGLSVNLHTEELRVLSKVTSNHEISSLSP